MWRVRTSLEQAWHQLLSTDEGSRPSIAERHTDLLTYEHPQYLHLKGFSPVSIVTVSRGAHTAKPIFPCAAYEFVRDG